MRLTLEALETLEAIAAGGSFAKAAQALHRVPSAVTYTVQKLESDLGVALFDRSGKRAVLTAAGKTLLERGSELVRQAENLENAVRRIADGWETQLSIAVDEVIPLELMFPIISEFDALVCGTRLRFSQEIFGGAWDALIDRRADLSIAASGDAPQGYGLQARRLGDIAFVFACAPHHPLADTPEPLPARTIARYRSIVAADSSRRLAPRSSGLQPGQDILVVPTLAAKLLAQVQGLGVGFLPGHMAAPYLAAGKLVTREVEHPRDVGPMHIAWRGGEEGRALKWFRDRVLADAPLRALLSH